MVKKVKIEKSETQLYRLFLLLRHAGDTGVSKDAIVRELSIKESSVPVYVHSLKKKYGAVIENQTEKRSVTGYILKNEVCVPQFRRYSTSAKTVTPKTVTTPILEGEVPILDTDHDSEYSDRELADIVSQTSYMPNGEY